MKKFLFLCVSFYLLAGTSFAAQPDLISRFVAQQRVFTPLPVRALNIETGKEARSGCCSNHGGVAGCDSSSGRALCGDGTIARCTSCASRTDKSPDFPKLASARVTGFRASCDH